MEPNSIHGYKKERSIKGKKGKGGKGIAEAEIYWLAEKALSIASLPFEQSSISQFNPYCDILTKRYIYSRIIHDTNRCYRTRGRYRLKVSKFLPKYLLSASKEKGIPSSSSKPRKRFLDQPRN